MSRAVRAACVSLALASVCGLAFGQQPMPEVRYPDELPPVPEVRELLAVVNGTDVYADEIEPLPSAKEARVEAPGSDGFNRWLDGARRANFQHRVIQLLQVRFVEEQGLLPTEDEIRAVREFRTRQQERRLAELILLRDGVEREVNLSRVNGVEPPDAVLEELRRLRGEVGAMEKLIAGRQPRSRDSERAMEIAERQFAERAVESWKFTRMLHEKYGGKVLQLGATAEPVEAYLRLFEEEQSAGRLRFETEWAKQAVVGAFQSLEPRLVEPLPDAFTVPWWLSDVKSDTPAPPQGD